MSRLMSDVREMVHEQTEFHELLWQMVRRDLLLRYKQTVMGFGWAIFMPLVNTVVFTVIFARAAHVTVDMPYPLFAYTGFLFWNLLAAALRAAVTSLTGNTNLVTKVYFPREIFPFSAVIVAVVDSLVGGVVIVGMLIYYKIPVSGTILFLPILLIVQLIFTAAVSLLLGMANLFYRDVKYLFEVVVIAWMFASPVAYSVNEVSGLTGRLIRLNPMTTIIEGYRDVIIRGHLPDMQALGVTSAVSVLLLAVAWLAFHRAEFRFAENV
jgi:ABC-type polysaccharide/polyol phosphate export permease